MGGGGIRMEKVPVGGYLLLVMSVFLVLANIILVVIAGVVV